MQDSSEEANDSISMSSTSTLFELPEYILRNLTPAKKSDSKDKNHRIRKLQIIQSKTLKLKKRSQTIQRKIQNLRLHQELISNKIAVNLSDNLHRANDRRMAFLAKRRERARKVQLNSLRLPVVLPLSVESIAFPKNGESRIEFAIGDIQSIIIIQRSIKKYVLLLNVNHFKTFQVSKRLTQMTYNEILLLLKPLTEFTKTTVSILRNLNLPDILPQQRYKSFLYSLIMIADYKDSLIHHTHSGFNTNISDRNMNNLANSVSLLLFKLADSVLNKFTEFIHSDLNEIRDPWSLPKLELCKSWKVYHFLFQAFRTLHFNNCMVIINDAMEIANKQLLVCKAIEIEIQRERYANNHKYLYKLSQVFNFSSTEWAYFGEDPDTFINNIKLQVFDKILPERPKVKAGVEVLEGLDNIIESSSNHSIIFGRHIFNIPPKIPINKWRKYWIQQYRAEKRINIRNRYGIPNTLRSGFFNLNHQTTLSNIYIENVFRELGMVSIHNKYESLRLEKDLHLFLTDFDLIVSDVFLILFEYCIKFEDSNNSEGFDIAITQFRTLKNSYQVANPNTNEELLQYFKLHFLCLSHLASIGPFVLDFVPIACSGFIDILNNLKQVSLNEFEVFINFYEELEILVMNLWVNKCKNDSIKKIKSFENVCQFISKKNFKIENATNSPHLRFPLFYNFLSRYDRDFDRHVLLYNSIIDSTFEYPDFESFLVNASSLRYFRHIYINSILDNLWNCNNNYDPDYSTNEFNVFFKEEMKVLIIKCRALLISDCVLHLILNICSKAKTSLNTQQNQNLKGVNILKMADIIVRYFSENINAPDIDAFIYKIIDDHFEIDLSLDIDILVSYVHKEYNTLIEKDGYSLLKQTLTEKFVKLINTDPISTEFEYLLKGNFKYFSIPTRQVIAEINEILEEIYDLYSPLLNWIYKDIGKPTI